MRSWTKMYGQFWEHHWIIKATCSQEALERARDVCAPPGPHGQTHHLQPRYKRWKHGGYEVVQGGVLIGA